MREKQIIEGAIEFFAEKGFNGDTRALAAHLGITHSLLFKYFPNKEILIDRVYEEVFVGRWNPYWEMLIGDRTIPLLERLTKVYQSYYNAIKAYEWVRLFMFAGLKGSELNKRWLKFVVDHLVQPICVEIRHEFGLASLEDKPLQEMEKELVLGVSSRLVALCIRSHIYSVGVPNNCARLIELEVLTFYEGAKLAWPTLVSND